MSPGNKSRSSSVGWTDLDGEYAYLVDLDVDFTQVNTGSGIPLVLNDIDPYNMSGHDALGQVGCARIVVRDNAIYAKPTFWKHISAGRLCEIGAKLVPVGLCGFVDNTIVDYRFLYFKIQM
jgi:hypothetical protein